MSWIVFNTSQLESNLTSFERVKEYCNTPREVRVIINSRVNKNTLFEKNSMLFLG